MNSANSEITNNPRKIQNDQWPRRFALKFCQRRRFSGDSASWWRSGGTANPIGACAVVSGTWIAVRSSTSDLPRLEIDARINPGVGEVGDQVHQKPHQRQDVERGEHHRVITVEHALEAEQPDAVEGKDRLDQQRAGKEGVHEGAGKARDQDRKSTRL